MPLLSREITACQQQFALGANVKKPANCLFMQATSDGCTCTEATKDLQQLRIEACSLSPHAFGPHESLNYKGFSLICELG